MVGTGVVGTVVVVEVVIVVSSVLVVVDSSVLVVVDTVLVVVDTVLVVVDPVVDPSPVGSPVAAMAGVEGSSGGAQAATVADTAMPSRAMMARRVRDDEQRRGKVTPGGEGECFGHGAILRAMLDLTATETALRSAAAACRSERDVVVVTGEEAASYLHGQVSQNVSGLAVGHSARTLVLSPQGRIDAWARVTRVDDQTFWLDVDSGHGPRLLERLERFKLRTKATFELMTMTMISVRGPSSPAPEPISERQVDVPVLWGGASGFDRLGVDIELPPGVTEGDPLAFEALRIRAGQPVMGAEVGEKTIPAELGIVEASVDFTKGCYVGQELVARVDSRGNNTPRRVWGISADEPIATGASVEIGGEAVGVVTSSAPTGDGRSVALASIARSAAVPGPAEIDGVSVEVLELPAG
ncbi:MAG: hypothetical protein R2733_21530 [Acidimicrobiales bacterium]